MIVKKIELACDICGMIFDEGMSNEPARSVRKIAKSRGWTYINRKDRCIKCSSYKKSIGKSNTI